jgi:ribosomal protein S18 acetylase RimI-like enzyme
MVDDDRRPEAFPALHLGAVTTHVASARASAAPESVLHLGGEVSRAHEGDGTGTTSLASWGLKSHASRRVAVVRAWDIEVSDHSATADTTELRNALHEYNFARTGYRDGRELSCFVRDQGRLVAGIAGFTWGGYARIDMLWIDEALRRQGLGRALLAAAEAEARRRGCTTVVLETHSFQAPDFYAALGYQKVGETTETPSGYTQLTFQKQI